MDGMFENRCLEKDYKIINAGCVQRNWGEGVNVWDLKYDKISVFDYNF